MQCEWGEGFKTHSPHMQKLFFDEKWKKERGEIGGRCLHFFTLLILVKLFKSIEVGIIYIGQWGGEGLMLVEVEVFSSVGGGGNFFQGN